MLLENITLFRAIVRQGSLAAAARQTGLSTTTVSERLAALETHYGVALLNRTTRSISLTDEGRTLIDGAQVLLGEVEELESLIKTGAQTLSGPIRISAPIDLGRSGIAPIISAFAEEHPGISVDLLLSDGYVDLVGQGFDIALRFGDIADSTLRTRRLGQFRRVVCAAPGYLETHGRPREPADLQNHNCLTMRFGEMHDTVWKFQSGKKSYQIPVSGNLSVNDGALVRGWALQGYGVILKSELDIRNDLKAGRLVALLEDFSPPPRPIQLLLQPSRARPKRIAALADRITEYFRRADVQAKPTPW